MLGLSSRLRILLQAENRCFEGNRQVIQSLYPQSYAEKCMPNERDIGASRGQGL